MSYHKCSKCNTFILKDHDPEYKHYGQCLKNLCIWCVHLNYQNQYKLLIQQVHKHQYLPLDLHQFQAQMSCCNKKFKGALYQLQSVLDSNCCIHGFNCPQIKKSSQFMHEYDYHLKVGKQCYRQLSNKSLHDQTMKTKHDRKILEKLNNLSIKKCEYCQLRQINIAIGSSNQINYRYCSECYYNELNQQKLTNKTQTKHTNLSNSNLMKQKRQKYKLQRQQCDNQLKYTKSQNKLTQNSNSSICSKCYKYFPFPFLTEHNHCMYCHFCLFNEFKSIVQQRQQNKITELKYTQELIKFQQKFYNNCLTCGFNFDFADHNDEVFTLPYNLDACYCMNCSAYLQKDSLTSNNLIQLKDILVNKNLWNNRQDTKLTIKEWRQNINQKLQKLQILKEKQLLNENLKKKQILKEKYIAQPKPITIKIEQKQLQTNIDSNNENKNEYKRTQIIMKHNDFTQNKTMQSLASSSKLFVQQQQQQMANTQQSNKQQKDKLNQQQEMYSVNQSDQDLQTSKLNQTHERIILQSQLIKDQFQQSSNTNQFSPQSLQLQQVIKLQLKNQIIDYSLQQYSQQHINNKQLSLSIFNNQIKPFLLNNQSLKTSIQHIQQLNSLLLNTPYFNPNLQLNQPNQINQQVNQINHFKNQQISSNKPSIKSFFSAKQSHCLNCHQLDFLLAFDQLCHQCFLNYLMGANLHAL